MLSTRCPLRPGHRQITSFFPCMKAYCPQTWWPKAFPWEFWGCGITQITVFSLQQGNQLINIFSSL